jgi:hypothetical protein
MTAPVATAFHASFHGMIRAVLGSMALALLSPAWASAWWWTSSQGPMAFIDGTRIKLD